MSIYNHLDYKNYLREVIKTNRGQRGFQSRMCQAMGCSNSLLSQCLNGSVHLTLEHSHKLGAYLALTEVELQYLLMMVQYARAGTVELRDFFMDQLVKLQEKHNQVSMRLNRKPVKLDDRGALIYSRHWSYPAIHIAINIPRFRQPEALAQLLHIPETQALKVLSDLKEFGLAQQVKGEWVPGEADLHIPKESPVAPFVHVNWRHRTINKILSSPLDGTHYSGIHAMDAKTYRKLKSEIVEILARFRNEISESRSEDLVFMSLDLYPLSF
ncbi:MAG: TIGR02147 family protein [Bdellovibrionaceae bacterium]|nr:TIGR02147 family protein [Pseudobdellovibrionaceae bacterium]